MPEFLVIPREVLRHSERITAPTWRAAADAFVEGRPMTGRLLVVPVAEVQRARATATRPDAEVIVIAEGPE